MFAASKSGKAAAGGGGATDPSFAYVPLLLNTGSTNGQQNNTFLDSSTNNFTITRNGTPTQGSITPYWPNGQWSNYFTTNNYINSTTNSNVFQFGSNAYTVEGWIYQTSRSATQYICGGLFSGAGFQISIDTSGFIAGIIANVGNLSPATTAVPLNTWTHFAIVRTSTSTNGAAYYINGAAAGTITDSNNISGTASAVNVGTSASAGSVAFNGYISNFRVTNGRAVYSGAFTPSTVPLTATTGGTNPPTGTQCTLLTCQSNRFKDNSAQVTPSVFTPSGSPTVQAFQPFSPTASYTTALYGGSGYFGGSDYLSAGTNSAFIIGTGDFTIELWVYLISYGNTYTGFFTTRVGGQGMDIQILNSSSTLMIGNSAGAIVSANNVVPFNAWTHICGVRSGSSNSLYVNGTRVATGTDSTNFTDNGAKVGTSGPSGVANPVAYISNVRFVKGTAVYSPASTTITVPTSPVTAITNTALLLNFTNAGIYDAAVQNDIITVGDAQASTTVSKWSPTSMRFDGTGDYLTLPVNSADTFGSGNWTIEGWFYFSSVSGFPEIFSKETPSNNGIRCVLVSSRVNLSLSSNGTTYATTVAGGTNLTTGTWYYLAFTRSSNAITIYLNGTSDGAGTFTGSLYETNTFWSLASRGGAGTLFNGYIQDFRITKGVARTITASPTAAFPTR
jgi:hypothetical protein